jgi:hypothetical protein
VVVVVVACWPPHDHACSLLWFVGRGRGEGEREGGREREKRCEREGWVVCPRAALENLRLGARSILTRDRARVMMSIRHGCGRSKGREPSRLKRSIAPPGLDDFFRFADERRVRDFFFRGSPARPFSSLRNSFSLSAHTHTHKHPTRRPKAVDEPFSCQQQQEAKQTRAQKQRVAADEQKKQSSFSPPQPPSRHHVGADAAAEGPAQGGYRAGEVRVSVVAHARARACHLFHSFFSAAN